MENIIPPNPRAIKKTVHRSGSYLHVNITSEEAEKIGLREGDRIQIEKIIELTESELENLSKESDDIETYE